VTTGKTYRCSVQPTSLQGMALASVASPALVVGAPDPPTRPIVSSVGNAEVKVSFTGRADNGAPITSFRAVCSSTNGGVARSAVGTASPLVVKRLTSGKRYTCSVVAINTRGAGTPSPASAAVLVPISVIPNAGSGYWMLGADGTVYPFGSARLCPDSLGRSRLEVSLDLGHSATAIVPMPDGLGYWALDSGGFVDAFECESMPPSDVVKYEGTNVFTNRLVDGERPVAMSALPDGSGYWVFTDHGRVIPFGHAHSYGDMSNVHLNGPIVGAVATRSGHGYYMVASDGGIFTFGDAVFNGSEGGTPLNAPIVGIG
jgi:hypothetical protein